jgi:hypothetical protein
LLSWSAIREGERGVERLYRREARTCEQQQPSSLNIPHPPIHPEFQRIFELPIYTCTEKDHYKEQEASFEIAAGQFMKPHLQILNKGPEFDAKQMENFRRNWFEREGRPWDFNRIVGWVRLYARKGNIVGYLFFVAGRTTKNMVRKRFLIQRGKFLEVRVSESESSAEIFERLRRTIIEKSRDSRKVRALHLDTDVLDVLGPFIDWAAMIY